MFTGPLYDPATSTLHFVDISQKKVKAAFTLFYFQPCFHLVQVFHVNIWSLDLSIEQFEEPVSCLALRRQGAGVSIHLLLLFKDICLISFSYPALPPKDLRSLKEILL